MIFLLLDSFSVLENVRLVCFVLKVNRRMRCVSLQYYCAVYRGSLFSQNQQKAGSSSVGRRIKLLGTHNRSVFKFMECQPVFFSSILFIYFRFFFRAFFSRSNKMNAENGVLSWFHVPRNWLRLTWFSLKCNFHESLYCLHLFTDHISKSNTKKKSKKFLLFFSPDSNRNHSVLDWNTRLPTESVAQISHWHRNYKNYSIIKCWWWLSNGHEV